MTVNPTDEVGTRLLFENEHRRVWNLALAPGETLEKHIHRRTYVFIVESGGLITVADPDNPEDAHDVQFIDDEVVWVDVDTDGKVDNRLINSGTKRHRNDVVELK